jgi:hypothetical protein
MQRALLAQFGDGLGWPALVIFLSLVIAVLAAALYLFVRSKPPPGGPPRVGE